jgi:hypothetical protein
MAGSAQERILDNFLMASGLDRSVPSMAGAISAAFGGATLSAWTPLASPLPFSGKSARSGSGLLKFFESGFGLGGLASELFGLFGGGDSQPAPALSRYIMPNSLNFEAADTGNGIGNVDYDQTGMPRAYGVGQSGASGNPTPGTYGPQITVNVQAMDSRSFLDRSTDIAAAVRNAMLNLNSINDVVSEL